MKKNISTSIVIVFTIVTSWFIIVYSEQENKLTNNEIYVNKRSEVKINPVFNRKTEQKNHNLQVKKTKDYRNSKSITANDNEDYNAKICRGYEEKNSNNFVGAQLPVNNEIKCKVTYEGDLSDEASVFKVSTDVIRKEMTLTKKLKLFKIAGNLPKEDYEKVREYLYWSDEEEGVRNIISLIRYKLSEDDYEKVKDILYEYVNMDIVTK